jgi:hypothetical protein
MNSEILYYLNDFVTNEIRLDQERVNEIMRGLEFSLPDDYVDFMKEYNGGEGPVGENSWLYLFPPNAGPSIQ